MVKNLPAGHQKELMAALGFTPEDLAMNDDGFLTDAQQNMLNPTVELYLALSVIGAFFSFCAATAFFVVGQYSDKFIFPISVCLFVFGISFYGIIWSLKLKKMIKSGFGVKTAEGWAELTTSEYWDDMFQNDRRRPRFFLTIDDIKFELNEEAFQIFRKGRYRVYYFPLLKKRLLSVEPSV